MSLATALGYGLERQQSADRRRVAGGGLTTSARGGRSANGIHREDGEGRLATGGGVDCRRLEGGESSDSRSEDSLPERVVGRLDSTHRRTLENPRSSSGLDEQRPVVGNLGGECEEAQVPIIPSTSLQSSFTMSSLFGENSALGREIVHVQRPGVPAEPGEVKPGMNGGYRETIYRYGKSSSGVAHHVSSRCNAVDATSSTITFESHNDPEALLRPAPSCPSNFPASLTTSEKGEHPFASIALQLPSELWWHITAFLPPADILASISLVSKPIRALCVHRLFHTLVYPSMCTPAVYWSMAKPVHRRGYCSAEEAAVLQFFFRRRDVWGGVQTLRLRQALKGQSLPAPVDMVLSSALHTFANLRTIKLERVILEQPCFVGMANLRMLEELSLRSCVAPQEGEGVVFPTLRLKRVWVQQKSRVVRRIGEGVLRSLMNPETLEVLSVSGGSVLLNNLDGEVDSSAPLLSPTSDSSTPSSDVAIHTSTTTQNDDIPDITTGETLISLLASSSTPFTHLRTLELGLECTALRFSDLFLAAFSPTQSPAIEELKFFVNPQHNTDELPLHRRSRDGDFLVPGMLPLLRAYDGPVNLAFGMCQPSWDACSASSSDLEGCYAFRPIEHLNLREIPPFKQADIRADFLPGICSRILSGVGSGYTGPSISGMGEQLVSLEIYLNRVDSSGMGEIGRSFRLLKALTVRAEVVRGDEGEEWGGDDQWDLCQVLYVAPLPRTLEYLYVKIRGTSTLCAGRADGRVFVRDFVNKWALNSPSSMSCTVPSSRCSQSGEQDIVPRPSGPSSVHDESSSPALALGASLPSSAWTSTSQPTQQMYLTTLASIQDAASVLANPFTPSLPQSVDGSRPVRFTVNNTNPLRFAFRSQDYSGPPVSPDRFPFPFIDLSRYGLTLPIPTAPSFAPRYPNLRFVEYNLFEGRMVVRYDPLEGRDLDGESDVPVDEGGEWESGVRAGWRRWKEVTSMRGQIRREV
ncbi:hypothetical protein BDV98DRAFT_608794 [Pterulicium gracile]|uniref:F-box domain-containing protein n=1 Tax=Pterulicium gracile TaxID=1884261 RepID=A0A5C3Q3F2_9AGAR|nr:hypothetical protein BDV98DRAFT_608794 [Pterula gracilis]